MRQTDVTNTQDQKSEDTYKIPPEFESYMGPETINADGGGVDLDVQVPVPPRPPPRKKKVTTGDNQVELVDDDSEDDYIYPDAPEETEDERKKKDKASDDEGYHYPGRCEHGSRTRVTSRANTANFTTEAKVKYLVTSKNNCHWQRHWGEITCPSSQID